MHPNDVRALFHRLHGQKNGPTQTVLRVRFIGQCTDQTLPARAEQYRAAQSVVDRQIVNDREIFGQRFAKANAWIDEYFIALYTRRFNVGDAMFKPVKNV